MNLKSFITNKRNLGYLIIGSLFIVLLVWLVIFPLGTVLSKSFQDHSTNEFTFTNWSNTFVDTNLLAISNSLALASAVTVVSTILAFPVAFLLSKTKLKRFWWLSIIMMIPFMIPPYINSLGWMSFMQRNGILWKLSESFHPLSEMFYSFFGMVWIMSMHTFPFLTTILITAFNKLPSNIEDANLIYSSSKIKKIFKVYFPILLPNFLIGAFLVFVKALSEYGTPATFGAQINYTVFTTLITNYMQVSPINFEQAATMASILVSICMILWLIQTKIVDKKSYALQSDGKSKISNSNALAIVGVIGQFVLSFFSTIIPLGSIIISSLKKVSSRSIFYEGNFTFDNYNIALNQNDGFGTGITALGNTFYISFISSLIVLLLGIVIGIYIRRNRKRVLSKGVELLTTLPQMIPNIVTGIGIIMFYNAIYQVLPIYRTSLMLIIGYTITLLPQSYSYIKSSLTQMPDSLFEAGEIFSKNKIITDLRIVLPNAIHGAIYGFIMTLVVSFRELIVAKLLQPPSYYTVSLYIDAQYSQGNRQAAMALTVISVVIILAILLPLEFYNHKRTKKGV